MKFKLIFLLLIISMVNIYANDKKMNFPESKSFGLSFGLISNFSEKYSYGTLVSFLYKSKIHRKLQIELGYETYENIEHDIIINSIFSFYPMIKKGNNSNVQLSLGMGPGILINGFANVLYFKPSLNLESTGEIFLKDNFSFFCSYRPQFVVSLDATLSLEFDEIYLTNNLIAGFNFYFERSKNKLH